VRQFSLRFWIFESLFKRFSAFDWFTMNSRTPAWADWRVMAAFRHNYVQAKLFLCHWYSVMTTVINTCFKMLLVLRYFTLDGSVRRSVDFLIRLRIVSVLLRSINQFTRLLQLQQQRVGPYSFSCKCEKYISLPTCIFQPAASEAVGAFPLLRC
jgi:hypothetical protein